MPTNQIAQKDTSGLSPLNSAEANRQLRNFLRAQPWIECDLISVITEGSKAILGGCAYSAAERENVEAAAMKLTGITQVENRITLIKEQQT